MSDVNQLVADMFMKIFHHRNTKLVWQKQICKNHKSECALFGIVQISSRCCTICNFCETDVSDMLESCRRGVRGRYEYALRLSTSGSKTRSRRTISSQNECFSRGDAARVCSQVKLLACWAGTGWPFTWTIMYITENGSGVDLFVHMNVICHKWTTYNW